MHSKKKRLQDRSIILLLENVLPYSTPKLQTLRRKDSPEPAGAQLCLHVYTGGGVSIFIAHVLRVPHYKKLSKDSMNTEVIH